MWLFEDKVYEPEDLDPKKIQGFVYIIENKCNGRKYIGKKFFWSMKSRQVKGKKKRFKSESDWRDYHGSSEELKNDVLKYGKENFIRTILHLCISKSECSYLELKEQISNNALLDDNYYNAWIQVKIRKAHLTELKKAFLEQKDVYNKVVL